jgi:signal transduction histidine kinase
VFEPFFTTRGAEGASGLGLTVALGLAHLQGGDLALESAPDRGAAFVLRLPAAA